MVIPGNFSFPLWVLGYECPPKREIKDKSKLNLLINHSTAAPLSAVKTLHKSVAGALGSP